MSDESNRTMTSVSGRTVVIGMFIFAAIATAVLSYYWNRHLEPFMPLQSALVQKYGKGSKPRVDGGQRKMSKGTPTILRVVMGVKFDPTLEENEVRVRERIVEIAEIATDYVELSNYEVLTVHLYQENPGKSLRQKTFETPLAELGQVDAGG